MKVKISEIKKKRDAFPRERLNEDAIKRYMILYKQGKTKPLIVQKDTKVLIDGFHRLEALKRLGEEYVEVEERDIPDSEILIEAYRLNKGHGVPITREERNNLIIKLRFDQERTLEDIAKIFDLSVSGIKRVCDNFSIFSPKKTKVDRRKKTESKYIIKAFLEGMKQKEIAGRFHISEGRVSQVIGKYGKWKEKGKVNILGTPANFWVVFNAALGFGLFETSVLELKKEGFFVRKYDHSRKGLALLAFFSKHFFDWYEVKEEIDALCGEYLLSVFNPRKVDTWEMWGDSLTVSFDEEYVYIRAVGNKSAEYTKRYGVIGKQKFPLNIPVDENGFVSDVDLKILVRPKDFAGMGTEGDARLSLANDNLKVECIMANNWKANKVISLKDALKIKGEPFPLQLNLDANYLSRALKFCAWMEGAMRDDCRDPETWICFYKDKRIVIVTSLPSPESRRAVLHPWFLHFVMGTYQ